MRKLIVILAVLLIANSSFGQFRLGLKAGVNVANFTGFDEYKIRAGFNAGPIVQINVAKLFFVQSELLYSLKGFKYDYEDSIWSDHSTISLRYITLPVLFGFKAGKKISLKMGPEIGRLLSARNETVDFDISRVYKKFDIDADLALAYSYKKLAIDLRYNYGLKKLLHGRFADPYGNALEERDYGTNRVLQFSLCYFLK